MNTITSPGKFEGEPAIAPLLYALALEGASDDTAGPCELFRFGPGEFLAMDLAIPADVTPEDLEEAGQYAGAILREDDAGFVFCYLYEDKGELETQWRYLKDEQEEDEAE